MDKQKGMGGEGEGWMGRSKEGRKKGKKGRRKGEGDQGWKE